MKKSIRLIVLSIFIIILVFSVSIVFASTPFDVYSSASVNSSDIEKIGNNVIGIIKTAGSIIAICVLIFIGIKFMIASPDEKANLKGALAPYVVGAVLLFAATNIADLIYRFARANI